MRLRASDPAVERPEETETRVRGPQFGMGKDKREKKGLGPRSQAQCSGSRLKGPVREEGWRLGRSKPPKKSGGWTWPSGLGQSTHLSDDWKHLRDMGIA